MKNKLFENIGSNRFKLVCEDHDETDMSNPEEKREVQIARELINIVNNRTKHPNLNGDILKLANELLTMHGAKV